MKNVVESYRLIISPHKTKVLDFMGKYPVWTKIETNSKVVNRCPVFNYLGSEISHSVVSDVQKELNRFKDVCRTIHRTLKYKNRRD